MEEKKEQDNQPNSKLHTIKEKLNKSKKVSSLELEEILKTENTLKE